MTATKKRAPLVFLSQSGAIKFAANEKLSGRINAYKIVPGIYTDKTPGFTPGFAVVGVKNGQPFMYRESHTDAGIRERSKEHAV